MRGLEKDPAEGGGEGAASGDRSRGEIFRDVFWAVHHDLPRQGPGSDVTTRRLLGLASDLPSRPRALDIGCGPGRCALALAERANADVLAVDTHEPFLARLEEAARDSFLDDRITTAVASMDALPYADESFDIVWSEGSAYIMGFDAALREWKRLLTTNGILCITECSWTTDDPDPRARDFWREAYPAMRSTAANVAAATTAGYTVLATYLLPDNDWWDEYYGPMSARIAELRAQSRDDRTVLAALDAEQQEIDVRRAHRRDYGYVGYLLRIR